MEVKEISDIEIEAIVFKVIRANAECNKSKILRAIKSELPDIESKRISKAIASLINRQEGNKNGNE
jgi:hypothetical protein